MYEEDVNSGNEENIIEITHIYYFCTKCRKNDKYRITAPDFQV